MAACSCLLYTFCFCWGHGNVNYAFGICSGVLLLRCRGSLCLVLFCSSFVLAWLFDVATFLFRDWSLPSWHLPLLLLLFLLLLLSLLFFIPDTLPLQDAANRTTLHYTTHTYKHTNMHARDWFLVFVAIFVPPLAVWFKRGLFTKDFLINLVLFLLGFFPGLIHALYVISKHPYEEEGNRGIEDTERSGGYGSLA